MMTPDDGKTIKTIHLTKGISLWPLMSPAKIIGINTHGKIIQSIKHSNPYWYDIRFKEDGLSSEKTIYIKDSFVMALEYVGE